MEPTIEFDEDLTVNRDLLKILRPTCDPRSLNYAEMEDWLVTQVTRRIKPIQIGVGVEGFNLPLFNISANWAKFFQYVPSTFLLNFDTLHKSLRPTFNLNITYNAMTLNNAMKFVKIQFERSICNDFYCTLVDVGFCK